MSCHVAAMSFDSIAAWTATSAAGWTREHTREPAWVLSSPPSPSQRYIGHYIHTYERVMLTVLLEPRVHYCRTTRCEVAQRLFYSTVCRCASRLKVQYAAVL